MYPFLSGFWTTSGVSAFILFCLAFLHDVMGMTNFSPSWLFWMLQYLTWAWPFIGLFYIYFSCFVRHRHENTEKSIRRFIGGCIGAALVLTVSYLVLGEYRI